MSVFAFYLFAICVIGGGLFTVISRNPVHSVLWLILAFLSSAGLFVLLGAEFVAMLLVIVYVGAVAVLKETLEVRPSPSSLLHDHHQQPRQQHQGLGIPTSSNARCCAEVCQGRSTGCCRPHGRCGCRPGSPSSS